ncbi:MAG: cupin domain-containing protein [Candidatus Thorarchaeota archaeon]
MVRIYRARDAEPNQRPGYEARYTADIVFKEPVNSCGMILVNLDPGSKSSPHGHRLLEEVFMALTRVRIHVEGETFDLNEGDVAVVDPGEMHSFEVLGEMPARILAMKFPNIKDDKISPMDDDTDRNDYGSKYP